MKKITLRLLLLFLTVQGFAQQQTEGIRFIEGEKWENVLSMAQEKDKYIFMDCYTSWCGPCKALAKDIFTRKEVGDFFNAHFINVKYDMEKGVGIELKKHYQSNIIGFPTLLLINKEGKVVHQMAGFQEAEVLIAGMKAGMEGKSLFAYRDKYTAGERDLNFIKEYVNALNGAFLKEEVEKVVQEYMQSIPVEKLQEKDVWELVGTYIKDPYSPQFEYVVFNMDKMAIRLNIDRYKLERQLSWAMEKALEKLIELKKDDNGKMLFLVNAPAKMDTIMRLVNRANLKRAEELRAKSRIHQLELEEKWIDVFDYLLICHDIGVLGYSDRYLNEVVQYMGVHCKDKKLLKKCLNLMEELQQKEEKGNERFRDYYYDTLALLNEVLGNQKEAEKYRLLDQELREKRAKEFENFMKKSE